MAMAAALQELGRGGGQIETSAELNLVPHESGGYRIPSLRLELAVSDGGTQDELDRALQRAMDMCPICNALAGTDIQVTARPASPVSGTAPA
jgi:organic hydroperoxide reductase OsmC/OhrA